MRDRGDRRRHTSEEQRMIIMAFVAGFFPVIIGFAVGFFAAYIIARACLVRRPDENDGNAWARRRERMERVSKVSDP